MAAEIAHSNPNVHPVSARAASVDALQSVYALVEQDFRDVNALIPAQLTSDVALVEEIGTYIVESGGKRLRPLMVLLTTGALSYAGRDHIKAPVWVAASNRRAVLQRITSRYSDSVNVRLPTFANCITSPCAMVLVAELSTPITSRLPTSTISWKARL